MVVMMHNLFYLFFGGILFVYLPFRLITGLIKPQKYNKTNRKDIVTQVLASWAAVFLFLMAVMIFTEEHTIETSQTEPVKQVEREPTSQPATNDNNSAVTPSKQDTTPKKETTTNKPQTTEAEHNKKDGNVESHSQAMGFAQCASLQQQTAELMSGHTIIHVVNSPELSIVKYCADDGVILITCSQADGKMVTTKSNNRKGC